MKILVARFFGLYACFLLVVPGLLFRAQGQILQSVSKLDPGLAPSGGSGDSAAPVISSDGRFVLFASTANNLLVTSNQSAIPGLFPPRLNVFLRDRLAGTTTLVSINSAGTGGGNGDSLPVELSTTGQYALFESSASDLVDGDTNNATDVFVRDLVNARTLLVSANTNGVPGNGVSRSPAMTPDGKYVAFVSSASNLIRDDTNRIADIFVRDLQAQLTALVSVGAASTNRSIPGSGSSEAPLISADGRYIAFYSTATNLVRGVRSLGEIYIRDQVGGSTVWASAGARAALLAAFGKTNAVSFNHALGADGQFLAFETCLIGATTNGLILRYNLATGSTDLVHTNAAIPFGPYEELHSLEMTPDGRFIAFVANTNGTSGYSTCVQLWDATTGVSTLVSGDLAGNVTTNSICDWPTMDRSGRYVAFLSSAINLVTNAVPGDYHLYVRDTQQNAITLLDADTNGVGSLISPVTMPRLSADGRFAAFHAADGRLVTNDLNRDSDVFVRDLAVGTVELVSVRDPALPSATPNGPSGLLPMSVNADGRSIAFASEAENLVANDTNQCRDIFVRDLATGTTTLVSVATNGFSGDGLSTDPSIGADGRYVAFTSSADNLVAGDTNKYQDVFVRDLEAGTTILVSLNSTGTGPGNKGSYAPTLSADGRYVLFRSQAVNLAPGSFTGENLFLRDLQAGTNYALTTAGLVAAAVTPDGRFVAVADKPGAATGLIYVWDSLAAARIYTNSGVVAVTNVAISPDGNRLAYWTGSGLQLYGADRAANTNWLIASGTAPISRPVLRFDRSGQSLAYTAGTNSQVYLYDFATQNSLLVSHAADPAGAPDGPSDSPDITADGRFVAYRGAASNVVAGDTNGVPDIFLFDRQTGSNTLVSAGLSGTQLANNRSLTPVFSGDGRTLLFQSWATDILPGDFNHSSDVIAYTLLYAVLLPGEAADPRPWLSWPWVASKTYRVEYRDSLQDPDWKELGGTVTNAGTKAWLQDSGPAPDHRFYRILAF